VKNADHRLPRCCIPSSKTRVSGRALTRADRSIRDLYLGIISIAIGDSLSARAYMMRALDADPDVRLDPLLHAPSRLQFLQGVRDEYLPFSGSPAVARDVGSLSVNLPGIRPAVVDIIERVASDGADASLSGIPWASFSLAELRLVRNTLYARRGHIFQDVQLRSAFASFGWYRPETRVTLVGREFQVIECITMVEQGLGRSPLPRAVADVTGSSALVHGDGTVLWRDQIVELPPHGVLNLLRSPDCLGEWLEPQYRRELIRPTRPHIEAKEYFTRMGPVLLVSVRGGLLEEDPPLAYTIVTRLDSGSMQSVTVFGLMQPEINWEGHITHRVWTCDGSRRVIQEVTETWEVDHRGAYAVTRRVRVETPISHECPG
jgi:hypothetical protein